MSFKPLQELLAADDRGVTWTIEAFLSVSLLLAILVISVQLIPSAATSAEQANYQQSQFQQDGSDVLTGASATGELSEGLRYWDAKNDIWHNAIGRHNEYANFPSQHPLETPFGLLDEDNVFYNMEISYQGNYDTNDADDESGTTITDTVVYQGAPSDNAVVVEYTTLLFKDDPILLQNGNNMQASDCGNVGGSGNVTVDDVPTDEENSSVECSYVIPDAFPEDTTDRYNVVRVRLTLWS